MNKIPNRKVICEVLMEKAKDDKDIVVLCSDSRGSASLAAFFDASRRAVCVILTALAGAASMQRRQSSRPSMWTTCAIT